MKRRRREAIMGIITMIGEEVLIRLIKRSGGGPDAVVRK